jgi:hypothetical protein
MRTARITIDVECEAPEIFFTPYEQLSDVELDQLHPVPCEGAGIGEYCEGCTYCALYDVEID